jgi:hypothetical protein
MAATHTNCNALPSVDAAHEALIGVDFNALHKLLRTADANMGTASTTATLLSSRASAWSSTTTS